MNFLYQFIEGQTPFSLPSGTKMILAPNEPTECSSFKPPYQLQTCTKKPSMERFKDQLLTKTSVALIHTYNVSSCIREIMSYNEVFKGEDSVGILYIRFSVAPQFIMDPHY